MSGWIKWEKNLETDPRMMRIIRHMKRMCNAPAYSDAMYVTHVCGALLRLWSYADSHIREDDTLDMGAEELDDYLGIPGFTSVLPEDWFQVIDEQTVKLPNFQEHNGIEAKKKASGQKRVETHRNRKRNANALQGVTGALPDQTRPDQTRPEKNSEKTDVEFGNSTGCTSNRPCGESNPVRPPGDLFEPSDPPDLGHESPPAADRDAVQRIFEHWRTTHGHERAQLDPNRRKLIRNALKHYSEADLCQSITGYLNSPHHMGDNDRQTVYDDVALMLRDAKHIDAGLKFYTDPPRTERSKLMRKNISAVETWEPPEVRAAK